MRASAVADASTEAVSVTGLEKSFQAEPVLRGVTMEVPAGSIVALLGPSGCGKTTLLRTIAGLERPDAGMVTLGGRVLDGPGCFVPAERRRVGMVFQDCALFPHLSVRGNVGFGLTRGQRRSGRVDEALALVELTGLSERLPATLSGGQQQRVALARALANRPAAILLDEPFSNLDAALRAQIRGDVVELLRELRLTALFVTHDQEEAFLVGDQVAVMLDGIIEQQAPPAQVYAAPASRGVATFVGDANFLAGRASGRHAATPVGAVPLRVEAHGPVDILVRPEQVAVRDGDDAVVEAIEYYGHDAVYRVRLEA
ncbi:MAG: ABC transporter ATP-binding protein, partial [Actinomycetota bacterium]|nr:ABC transporter ATP-binding protein [Actinomycetota bacterium]